MGKYIPLDALVAEIERRIKEHHSGYLVCLKDILSFINTLEVEECETKSGIVQKDLQILLDDGMYIDLDPSIQLKPSFSVKEGERVKVIISKEGEVV